MSKTPLQKQLIEDAISILSLVGLPSNKTARRNERCAMALLAVAGVTTSWKEAKSIKDGRKVTTREIIKFVNLHYGESIKDSSYDDIRRKDLRHAVLAELILNSADNPSAKTNDSGRGYSLENDFKVLLTSFGSKNWDSNLSNFVKLKGRLIDKINTPRAFKHFNVFLTDGSEIQLKEDLHNILQRDIIQQFLPRFGYNCQILYIGDTSNRYLYLNTEALKQIGFFEIGSQELPDVIAYSKEKKWLFLIEAVTSSGPMSAERVLELQNLSKNCTATVVFVTTFLSKSDFRKHLMDIAWETEVWIADAPDHLIHFNGDKFLGPHH